MNQSLAAGHMHNAYAKQRVNFRATRGNQNIISLVKVSLAEIQLEIFINRQPESIFLYS